MGGPKTYPPAGAGDRSDAACGGVFVAAATPKIMYPLFCDLAAKDARSGCRLPWPAGFGASVRKRSING